MKVDVLMEAPHGDPEIRRTIRAAAAALSGQLDTPAESSLTVRVTGDAEVQALNKQFLAIDAPTDVLAFPAGDSIENEPPYLGDIIISLEAAKRQAVTGGHPLAHEVELLVVHGILHLLGHDHDDPDKKAAMWAAQAVVLGALGNPLSPP